MGSGGGDKESCWALHRLKSAKIRSFLLPAVCHKFLSKLQYVFSSFMASQSGHSRLPCTRVNAHFQHPYDGFLGDDKCASCRRFDI